MKKKITIGNTEVYHSYPDTNEKHPGLILIEEIWGVDDHIRDVAERFAAEGYSVLAPEILPRELLEALTSDIRKDLFDPEKRTNVQPVLREAMGPIHQPQYAQKAINELKACVDYLLAHEGVNGNIAVLGFCFGGSYSFHLAAHDDRIKAAVAFYGQPPSEEEIQNITCPILAFYGDQDTSLIETLPKLEEDMQKAGKHFEPVVYTGVSHTFFNDTNPVAYTSVDAENAWNKTLDFLRTHLK